MWIVRDLDDARAIRVSNINADLPHAQWLTLSDRRQGPANPGQWRLCCAPLKGPRVLASAPRTDLLGVLLLGSFLLLDLQARARSRPGLALTPSSPSSPSS